MSLPYATQSQIDAMNKAAEEKMATEDISAHEVEEIQENNSQEETEITQEEAPRKHSPTKEDNLRILRERSERAERERDELMRYLQELQSQLPKSQQNNVEEPEDFNVNPDDLAEGKHLLKLVNKISKLEKKLEESEKKSYINTVDLKIKRDFPDFDKVASFDNLKKLREMDPDIADAILATTDPYKQYALAYKMVKNLGIYREDKYINDREIAIKNSAKPRPLTSLSPQEGEGPLSKANAFANGLTDELKKQLHREMIESMKNR